MPYFEVQITRNVIHLTTLTVEADDEDTAEKAALERVEDPEAKLEWEFEDETFEIENVDETDPPEDEEGEEEDETEDEDDEDEDAAN